MQDLDAFLRQDIESASSGKLRWMLIRKALGLCALVDDLWAKEQFQESVQWTIRIQDILTELLSGVTDPQNVIAAQVSDLYLFMCQLMQTAITKKDRSVLNSGREILDIEFETWSMFIQKEAELEQLENQARAAAQGEKAGQSIVPAPKGMCVASETFADSLDLRM